MVIRTRILRTLITLLLVGAGLASARAADSSAVVAATNDFGFRLYANLANSDGEKNLFISPLSVELALAMTYNGAHGSTRQAMAKTLGWEGLTLAQVNDGYHTLSNYLYAADPNNARLDLANSLWVSKKETFQTNFLQRDTFAYKAELTKVDFTDPQTVTRVNDWVSAHTAKMIPTIVQPGDFDGSTVLALVNALHFKGVWSKAFDRKLTHDATFTRLDGSKKTVPMMRKLAAFSCYEDDNLQIAKLPYGKGKLSMLIFLPKTTEIGDNPLQGFTAQLTTEHWQQWLHGLRPCRPGDSLQLPRFSADYSVELKKALSAMGMAEAFSGGADFTGMVKTGGIFIGLVRHKTAIEVNEESTEAAAATVVVMTRGGNFNQFNFHMVVDHPFFFAIVADDGTILFLGSIVDP